jgi:hypothetical protein
VYGLVLTFGLARALGLGRQTFLVVVRWAPTIAAGYLLLVLDSVFWVEISVVAGVFVINGLCSHETRRAVREGMLSRRRAGRRPEDLALVGGGER